MKRSINGVTVQTTGQQGPQGATGPTGPEGPQGAAGGLTTIVGGNTQTADAMLTFQVADAAWQTGIDYDVADRPWKIQRTGFGDVMSCSGTGAVTVAGVITYENDSLQILGPLSTVSALATDCIAIGTSALAGGSGYGTVAIGRSTGGAAGAGELNTFVGYRAGANSTGNNNTVVGGNAQAGITTANSIAIGFDATVQANDECVIGNAQLKRIRPMGICDLGSVNDPFDSLYVQGKIAMTSTTEAFTPPQLTTAERDLLSAAPGNLVYNTTSKLLNFYDGVAWQQVTSVSTVSYTAAPLAFVSFSTESPVTQGVGTQTTNGLKAAAEGVETSAFDTGTGFTTSTTPTSYDATSVNGPWMTWSFAPQDRINRIILYTRISLGTIRDISQCRLLLSTDAGATWTSAGRTEFAVTTDMTWDESAGVHRRFVVTFSETTAGIAYNRIRLVQTKAPAGGSGYTSIVEMEVFHG